MQITGNTTVLGLFGDPVEHSLSPIIHADFSETSGLDTIYVPFRISPENLEAAVSSVTVLGLRGVNITVPHKETVIPFLDELTESARAIGAVNTIINNGELLTGDNTDQIGFLEDLRHRFSDMKWVEKPALVLGAGGASRAVVYALRKAGLPEIFIANRDKKRAQQVASEMAPQSGRGMGLDIQTINPALKQSGLVVNTTSLGLKGESIPELDLTHALQGTIVYDLIYSPARTPLLHSAIQLGLPVANGLGMLVRQGAISYSRWTGSEPVVESLIHRLQGQLGT
ncbi:shikimate dehydrogenase [Thiohalorhabdus denitrificans]|uniref:Shikimate dehydrogenase (NADP(+)) n=1 Tax=Thiohalorhabdus denitrificans TaxID=381306 RepID=A0A1G5EIB7_9GAMM|nr:shikimate dehydrogenase [Thiohalorhabdus denitrificans]SCY26697.1 shikimate dehydrogenase [Thiohalorhabdus denitrificans]